MTSKQEAQYHPLQIEAITTAVIDAMREEVKMAAVISDKTHALHHTFLEQELERRQRRSELIEKVKTHVAGSVILSLLGTLTYVIGMAALEWLKRNIVVK